MSAPTLAELARARQLLVVVLDGYRSVDIADVDNALRGLAATKFRKALRGARVRLAQQLEAQGVGARAARDAVAEYYETRQNIARDPAIRAVAAEAMVESSPVEGPVRP